MGVPDGEGKREEVVRGGGEEGRDGEGRRGEVRRK